MPNIPVTTQVNQVNPSPSSGIVLASSQHANSSVSNRNTEKASYIVGVPTMTFSANPINYVQVQQLGPETGSRIIGLSLPPVQSFSTPVNADNMLAVQATQAPSNINIIQPTGVTIPVPTQDTPEREEVSEVRLFTIICVVHPYTLQIHNLIFVI